MGDLTFAPDGRQVCRRCAAHVSVAQADQRAGASFGGAAKILNPVAKHAMRNPRTFARLMMLGVIAIPFFVIFAVVLAEMFGMWLSTVIH